jgi:hypothetical protein
MHTSHEYRCGCGHVGWSTHIDILRHPLVAFVAEGTVDWGQAHRFVEHPTLSAGVCACGLPDYDRAHLVDGVISL